MQLAAQCIKLFFQRLDVDIQFSRQAEEAEIVHRRRRLDLAACSAKLRGAHVAARPTGVLWIGGRQRFYDLQCHKTRFTACVHLLGQCLAAGQKRAGVPALHET